MSAAGQDEAQRGASVRAASFISVVVERLTIDTNE